MSTRMVQSALIQIWHKRGKLILGYGLFSDRFVKGIWKQVLKLALLVQRLWSTKKGVHWCVLVRTEVYWCVLMCTEVYWSVLRWSKKSPGSDFSKVFLRTIAYKHIPSSVHASGSLFWAQLGWSKVLWSRSDITEASWYLTMDSFLIGLWKASRSKFWC